MTVRSDLAEQCVYTIAKPSELRGQMAKNEPRTENKWWAGARRLLDAARGEGRRLPVLFADAAQDCSRLFGWALLDAIEQHGSGTRFRFSEWQPLASASTQELMLLNGGEPIAAGFIRPYALCATPWFLGYDRAQHPVEGNVRAWIVKGKPSRNDLDEMLAPHRTFEWITRKPPKGWTPGDAVFFWKSAPELHVAGFGRIVETTTERNADGNVPFTLEYLTGPLSHRIRLRELREDSVLGGASFLKSGPAGTVFSLTSGQANRLARLVMDKNPSTRVVFEDHLLGIGSAEVLAVEADGSNDSIFADPEDLAVFEQHEGRKVLAVHYARERSIHLRERAKQLHRSRTGGLRCTVCDFDFAEVYGDPGADFAEVHHARPLSEYDAMGAHTKVVDLVVVCANCHRMLHRRRPWLAAADLKNLLSRG